MRCLSPLENAKRPIFIGLSPCHRENGAWAGGKKRLRVEGRNTSLPVRQKRSFQRNSKEFKRIETATTDNPTRPPRKVMEGYGTLWKHICIMRPSPPSVQRTARSGAVFAKRASVPNP